MYHCETKSRISAVQVCSSLILSLLTNKCVRNFSRAVTVCFILEDTVDHTQFMSSTPLGGFYHHGFLAVWQRVYDLHYCCWVGAIDQFWRMDSEENWPLLPLGCHIHFPLLWPWWSYRSYVPYDIANMLRLDPVHIDFV
jgi:hypothetical protein